MTFMSKNNSLALAVILLIFVVKKDTLWLYDPLDYLSWVADKRTSYIRDESQL